MSLAATIHGLHYDPGVLDPWKVLGMATRDGAKALHLDRDIGTLEPGKNADLVVVDLEEWSGLPGGDPASRIVFGCDSQMVRHVVVAGRRVVEDRTLITAKRAEVRSRVAEAWRSTRQRMEGES
jgi:cytosine/adenosine deaminase-related metal-dependent hydrolase